MDGCCRLLLEQRADNDVVSAGISKRARHAGVANAATNEQRGVGRQARSSDDLGRHRADRPTPRFEVSRLHPHQSAGLHVCRDDIGVRGQRSCSGYGLDRASPPSIDQQVRGTDRGHVWVTIEKVGGANLFFDEVARVAARQQNEKEHGVDVRAQLSRRGRELHDGEIGSFGADCFDVSGEIATTSKTSANQDPARASICRTPGDVSRRQLRVAPRVHEHDETAAIGEREARGYGPSHAS